jgi:hypothetical protein
VRRRTRLAEEIRRRLKVIELQQQLEGRSLSDLSAIEKLLERRLGVGRSGAERKYSEAEVDELRQAVREEMSRLKTSDAKRHGAKTAIRKLVVQLLTTERGRASVASNPGLIDRTAAEWFRVWEAGRKRG